MQKGESRPYGYTIVEVMIFLAVSGVMFLLATTFINGKQAQAEFTQSIGNISSKLQQVLDNVQNGYYPTRENFRCVGGSGGPPTFPAAPTPEGTNAGCIYIGEVVQFGVAGSNGEGYAIIPVVGNRTVSVGGATQEVTSFAEAHPTPLTTNFTSGHANMVDQETLQTGMHVTKMVVMPGSQPISGFGIFSTFGSYSSTGLLNSGSQSIILTTVHGMSYTYNTGPGHIEGVPITGAGNTAERRISQIVDSDTLTNNQSIVICFKSGYDKPASISLGSGSNRLIVDTETGSNIPGVCP